MKKVTILGSGIIGITTAYYLHKAGYKVVVIDRGNQAASECSFANGGQLSYSHAEPWANPSILLKAIPWLFKKDSPLVLRPKLEASMWRWLFKFLTYCTHKRADKGTKEILRLALYSKKCLKKIDDDEKISYEKLSNGTLHIFDSEKALKKAEKHAKMQKELGCDFKLLIGKEACIEKEPSLAYSPRNIVGGIFFPEDESGHVREFTLKLARILKKQGVEFHYKTTIEEIVASEKKIVKVITDKGEFESDIFIVSLGAYSPVLLKEINIDVPIYPMKGYSISIPIVDNKKAPKCAVTDQHNKIVYSRLGSILRCAGTAEFAGYNHKIYPKRIQTIKNMVKQTFPEVGDIDDVGEWSCLRPSTPSGLPIIGKSKYDNLFLNTGQGTLGWTLACGSAKVITDIIRGKKPKVKI